MLLQQPSGVLACVMAMAAAARRASDAAAEAEALLVRALVACSREDLSAFDSEAAVVARLAAELGRDPPAEVASPPVEPNPVNPWWTKDNQPGHGALADEPLAEGSPEAALCRVAITSLGEKSSDRRSTVRHRRGCCVCARSFWGDELQEVYFFKAPPGREAEGLFSDAALPASALGQAQYGTSRRYAHYLLSPERYHKRWTFRLPGGGLGGIPLEELRASSVENPDVPGERWLVHRRAFRYTDDGVVNPYAKVPVCGGCRSSLRQAKPTLPKFALANDFWMGQLPPELRDLSEGAWLLLALGRVMIRRYNCKSDSGHWLPKEQMIKAFVGNVCALPQADGGRELLSLPPSEQELVESLLICFTGLEKDMGRAFVKDLGVDAAALKAAYDFLRRSNTLYAHVCWDDQRAASSLQPEKGKNLDLPRCFWPCLKRLDPPGSGAEERAKKEGPAEAVAAPGFADDALRRKAKAVLSRCVAFRQEHGRSPQSAACAVCAKLGARACELCGLEVCAAHRACSSGSDCFACGGALKDAGAEERTRWRGAFSRLSAEQAAGEVLPEETILERVSHRHGGQEGDRLFLHLLVQARDVAVELARSSAVPDAVQRRCGTLQELAQLLRSGRFQQTRSGGNLLLRPCASRWIDSLCRLVDDPGARASVPGLAAGLEQGGRLSSDAEEEDVLASEVAEVFESVRLNPGVVDEELQALAVAAGAPGTEVVEEERNEFFAGLGDADVQLDVEQQWKSVEVQYRKLLLRMMDAARAAEAGADANASGRDAHDKERAALKRALLAIDRSKMEKELAAAERTLQGRRPPPQGDKEPMPEPERILTPDRRKALLVPSARLPLSMFDASFWSSVFPRCFPYGDGVFGLERLRNVELDEYLEYLLQREELLYPDPLQPSAGVDAPATGGDDVMPAERGPVVPGEVQDEADPDPGWRSAPERLPLAAGAREGPCSGTGGASPDDSIEGVRARLNGIMAECPADVVSLAADQDGLADLVRTVVEKVRRLLESASAVQGFLAWLSDFGEWAETWASPDFSEALESNLSSLATELRGSSRGAAGPSPTVAADSAPRPCLRAKDKAKKGMVADTLPPLPRWRGERDFLTTGYCFGRRKAYIRSSRLFANKERYEGACRDAGALDVDEFFAAISLAGKGQTWKDLMRRRDVPETVKRVFRHLQLCMANVLGTNAHRTALRHRATGYRWLWGAPLIFTTLNPADTRHPVMRLLHSPDLPDDEVDGEAPEVAAWRLLEEGEPDLGGKLKMVERVASDPVGQALLSDLMMKLFLKHMLGVDLDVRSDSVASSGRPGVFGDVKAYFAPLESQGRGGLHAHMNVWVCHPMKGRLLEKLRTGQSMGPAWQEKLLRWRREVLDKVGTMEFTSTEEITRQVGLVSAGAEAQLAFGYAPPELEEEYARWCELRLQERCSPEEFAKDQLLPQAEKDSLIAALATSASEAQEQRIAARDPGHVGGVVGPPQQHAECGICRCRAPRDFLRCPACTPLLGTPASLGESFARWVEDLSWSGLPGQGLFGKPWRERLGVVCPWVAQDSRPDVSTAKILVLSFLQDRQLSDAAFLEMLGELRSQIAWSDRPGPRGQDAGPFVAFLKHCVQQHSAEVFTEAWGREALEAMSEENRDIAWPMQALHHSLRFYCEARDLGAGFQSQLLEELRAFASGMEEEPEKPEVLLRYEAWKRKRRYAGLPSDALAGFVEETRSCLAPDLVADVPPLPLTFDHQARLCVSGRVEPEDAACFPAPRRRSPAAESSREQPPGGDGALPIVEEEEEPWRVEEPRGPARCQSYVPLQQEQLGLDPRGSRRDPCMELPIWRRLPPCVVDELRGGRAALALGMDSDEETVLYARVFARDARDNFVRSHIHRCKNTCYKHSGGGKPGDACRICRFGFLHAREVVYYPRPWPKKLQRCTLGPRCGLRQQEECSEEATSRPEGPRGGDNLVLSGSRRRGAEAVHPEHCPPPVPVGHVQRFVRKGKKLVLPRDGSFRPQVSLQEIGSGIGKCLCMRYHPECSSSNPAVQVAMRCNCDVQCTDRVFVFQQGVRMKRWRKKRPVPSDLPLTGKEYTLPIFGKYSRDISAGEKLVEARVPGTGKEDVIARVQVGDVLLLNGVRCAVTHTENYGSFRAMLQDVGYKNALPRAESLEEALAEYHGLGQGDYEERARQRGVRAFWLDVLPARERVGGRGLDDAEGDFMEEEEEDWFGQEEEEDFLQAMSDGEAEARALTGGPPLAADVALEVAGSEEGAASSGASSGEDGAAGPRAARVASSATKKKRVVYFAEDVEHWQYLVPDTQAEETFLAAGESWERALYDAFLRMFKDAHNQAHYQTDYSTKHLPTLGEEMPQQAAGLERIRREEGREAGASLSAELLKESGRKTLIRLQTSANRVSLKKLPEMVFAMLNRHECYASHQSWTLYCKGLVWSGFGVSHFQRLREADSAARGGENDLDLLRKAYAVSPEYSRADEDDEHDNEAEEPDRLGRFKPGADEGEVDEVQAGLLRFWGAGARKKKPAATMDVVPTRAQRFDWLHRGKAEPLASMGMYHYSMFVHSVRMKASTVQDGDYRYFRFDESHPDYQNRVQVLRFDEPHRVPKLVGMTMPREEGSRANRFRNALFKSVLFRPCSPAVTGLGLSVRDEFTWSLLPLVDDRGCFVGPWKAWFEQQQLLADRFEELQRRAGRTFVVSDIDTSLGYMAALTGERLRPSAAEFMANITVEVAVHLEIGAQARAGRPVVSRFKASDFDVHERLARDEHYDDNEDVAERVVDGAEVSLGKHQRARALFDLDQARHVALCEEIRPDGLSGMADYFRRFDEDMGRQLRADLEQATNATEDGGGFQWAPEAAFRAGLGPAALKLGLDKQKKEFKFDTEAEAPAEVEADEDGAVFDASGNIYVNPTRDPGLAELVDRGISKPRAYVRTAVRLLKTEKGIDLTPEQEDFLALVTDHVDRVLEFETRRRACWPRECGLDEPKQMRIFLGGPGGSGKSEVVRILRGLFGYLYEGLDAIKCLAASNSAARGIGGDTVHSGLFLRGTSRLTLKELEGCPDKLRAAWQDVRALIVEEVSLVSPQMFAGMSYRLCKARRTTAGACPSLYSHPDHMFGRIPLVVMLGDFMQLAPLEEGVGRASLVMPERPSWKDEMSVGREMFSEHLTHAVFLRKTMRFCERIEHDDGTEELRHCPHLPRLFEIMREPPLDAKGSPLPLPEDLEKEIKKWQVRSGDPRLKESKFKGGFEMGIAWHAVQRLMQYRALRDAASAGRMVVYSQAIDVSTKKPLDRAEYRRALQVVNMTKTGKLLGMCPLFVGMRVRLNAKLSAKHGVVHDAVGVVEDIVFHEKENLDWQTEADHPARKAGHVVLQYLPKAVLVRFDHLEDKVVGFEGRPGVVAVEPHGNSWKYRTHDRWSGEHKLVDVAMRRYQVPLAPERVRTVQTAQGLTMDAATMFLGRPKHMSAEDYWMHLYVMLSRVRMCKNILAYELPDLEVFTRGPPAWVREGIHALERLAGRTQSAVAAARRELGAGFFGKAPSEEESPAAPVSSERPAPVPGDVFRADGRSCERLEEALATRPAVPGRRSGVLQEHQEAGQRYGAFAYLSSPTAGASSDPGVPGRALLRGVPRESVEALYGEVPVCFPEAATLGRSGALAAFANPPGTHSCFVNAALQVFLRLAPVRCALLAHLEMHREGDGAGGFKPHVGCVACALAEQAVSLREGRGVDSQAILGMVRGGCFGASGGLGSSSPAPLDASEVLLGSSSFEDEVPAAAPAARGTGAGDVCDGLLGCLSAWERQQASSAAGGSVTALLPEKDIFRSFVFGCLLRHREHCLACQRCIDRVEEKSFVEVPAPAGKKGEDLVELLERALSRPHVSRPSLLEGHVCSGSNRGPDAEDVVRHVYLEREPPVLILRVRRNVEGCKDCTPVRFPETLCCMRTGRYRLAGVILHRGKTVEDGHFVACCSRGEGRYVWYDDDHKVKEVPWSHLDRLTVRREVYVLVYARVSFWGASACDGVESTPYSRPAGCLEAAGTARPADRPDRPQAGADGKALGAPGSSARRQNARSLAASAAAQRADMQARDPAERKRAAERLAEAERGRLEELQGRTIGRLKALQRDVPILLQKWSYDELLKFYHSQLPGGLSASEAREGRGSEQEKRSDALPPSGDPAGKRRRLAGVSPAPPSPSPRPQPESAEGDAMQSGPIFFDTGGGFPEHFAGDMSADELWAVMDFPGGVEGDVTGVDWRRTSSAPVTVDCVRRPDVLSWSPGHLGFRNGGTDCWMISVLQMLGSDAHLRNAFVDATRGSPQTSGMGAVRSDFLRSTGSASLCAAAGRRPAFGFDADGPFGPPQEDADEFLGALLRLWDECYPRAPLGSRTLYPPRDTPVYDLFAVLSDYATGCGYDDCRKVNRQGEEELRLRVPPPRSSSAGVALTSTAIWASTFGDVHLAQEDTRCSFCGTPSRIVRRRTLKKVGAYLILQLSLYDMGKPADGFPKLRNSRIEASPQIEVVVQGTAIQFELVAAVEHIGRSLRGGHYVTHRREASGSWRVLNDDGKTRTGPTHGSLLTEQEFLKRQMYLCMYARSSSSSTATALPAPAATSGAAASSASAAHCVGSNRASSAEVRPRASGSASAAAAPAAVLESARAAQQLESQAGFDVVVSDDEQGPALPTTTSSGAGKRKDDPRRRRDLRRVPSFVEDDPSSEVHAAVSTLQPKVKAKSALAVPPGQARSDAAPKAKGRARPAVTAAAAAASAAAPVVAVEGSDPSVRAAGAEDSAQASVTGARRYSLRPRRGAAPGRLDGSGRSPDAASGTASSKPQGE